MKKIIIITIYTPFMGLKSKRNEFVQKIGCKSNNSAVTGVGGCSTFAFFTGKTSVIFN